MKETFFFKSGDGYQLFIQVTYTTPCYEVLTIINEGEHWREDNLEYSTEDYKSLDFINKFDIIDEMTFAEAQNKILNRIEYTRDSLRHLYTTLWTEYLIEKVRIEEELKKSKINLDNFYLVSQFRNRMAEDINLNLKRQRIYDVYNKNDNQYVSFSNKDIFGKVANERLDMYLNRREEILKK